MVNDILPNCILSGTVVIKNDVHRFTENGVVFKGEENEVHEVDAVILATGYLIHFPFIDSKIISVQDNKVHLYKNMFEPRLQPHTLAFIGLIQPLGSVLPISEIQARLAARVFSGKLALPSPEVMEKDIDRVRTENQKRFVQTQRHTIQVDYMTYMDEIADLLNVKPNLRKLLISDPVLWCHCFLGANVPYQYRLQGPHSWPKARDAIIECGNRVRAPLQTRPNLESTNMSSGLSLSFSTSLKTSLARLWPYMFMAFGVLTLGLCFTLS